MKCDEGGRKSECGEETVKPSDISVTMGGVDKALTGSKVSMDCPAWKRIQP